MAYIPLLLNVHRLLNVRRLLSVRLRARFLILLVHASLNVISDKEPTFDFVFLTKLDHFVNIFAAKCFLNNNDIALLNVS